LLCRKGAIGIDKKTVISDRLARRSHARCIALRLAADLHLGPSAALPFDPTRKLAAKLDVRVFVKPLLP
jgi:hypothetical protein